MTILCIGDSNTNGYDPRSFLGERYPEGVRWTDRLKNREMINWGINGITIPHDCSVYISLIKRKEPDLVIVMLGTNDLLEGASAEQTAHRMEEFIDSIKTAGRKILLIAPPALDYGEYVQSEELIEESRKVGNLYNGIAEKKRCLFADAGEWAVEISFDGVHFTEEGHAAFAWGLDEVLKTIETSSR